MNSLTNAHFGSCPSRLCSGYGTQSPFKPINFGPLQQVCEISRANILVLSPFIEKKAVPRDQLLGPSAVLHADPYI